MHHDDADPRVVVLAPRVERRRPAGPGPDSPRPPHRGREGRPSVVPARPSPAPTVAALAFTIVLRGALAIEAGATPAEVATAYRELAAFLERKAAQLANRKERTGI